MLLPELLQKNQILIVGVPHAQYQNLVISEHIEEVVDLWNVVKKRSQGHQTHYFDALSYPLS